MINRIVNYVKNRFFYPLVIKYFHFTIHGRSIQKFKNAFNGKRCFFIGNGPSLKALDLTTLHKNNEITFAFNRIFNIYDQTDWRPTFYISQDDKMLSGCIEEIRNRKQKNVFIPIQLKFYSEQSINNAFYFNMNWQQNQDVNNLSFSDEPSKEIIGSYTGMYTAAQLAAYMGFSEIYLIGVDHHFQISQNNKGEIIVDNSVKDYFTDKYNEDKNDLYIPNTERSTLTYIAMKNHCDERNIKVYNATRGGKLEVFPRVDFDSLF